MMRAPGRRSARQLAALCAAATVLAGCGGSSEETSNDEPAAEAKETFDPLAFDEPEMPYVDGSPESRRDVERAVEYFADAWTYGLRTGYAMPFNEICPSSATGCDEVRDELVELSASGHHMEMGPIRIEIERFFRLRQRKLRHSERVGTIAPVIVQVTIPERVKRDGDNEEVEQLEADDRRLGLLFVSEPAFRGWVIYEWYDPERPTGAA